MYVNHIYLCKFSSKHGLAAQLSSIITAHQSHAVRPHLVNFLTPSYPFPVLSLEDLKAMGFSVKDGYTSTWAESEKNELQKFFCALLQDQVTMHNEDKFVFISRHILAGSKSPKEVKKYFLHMLKEHNKQQHNTEKL
jgi:hypothetical protein